jgi:hypothetical protein
MPPPMTTARRAAARPPDLRCCVWLMSSTVSDAGSSSERDPFGTGGPKRAGGGVRPIGDSVQRPDIRGDFMATTQTVETAEKTEGARGSRGVRRTPGAGGVRGARAAALLLAGLLGVAAVAGCGSGASHDDSARSGAATPRATANTGGVDAYGGSDDAAGDGSGATTTTNGKRRTAGGDTVTPAATYLVRTAQLGIRTPHVERQLDRARDYAAQDGGYAGDEDTTVDSGGHATSSVQLRVPAAAYDRLLTQLSGLGTLVSRTVSVKDVTGQVVDVQSRIKSQQASVARVRALMDRAGSLGDVVSLESELSTRESDLEALEAQQASLRSQTNLATVTLRLSEPPAKPAPVKAAKHDGFWTAAGHAARGGWHALYVTLRALLVAFLAVLPFAAVLLACWLTVLAVRRRFLPARRPVPGAAQARRVARPGTPAAAAPSAATESPVAAEPPAGAESLVSPVHEESPVGAVPAPGADPADGGREGEEPPGEK